ncbi:MAG: hotdog fold thioesterase [Pyrinomonadaceae bacterium]
MIEHEKQDVAQNRVRTIEWQDPLLGVHAARELSGIEYLRAMMRGEVPPPPIALVLGITVESIEEGSVVFAVEPAEYHYNPIGTVHAGLACTICDSAMGCAVHSTLPAGVGWTTLELKVNLVRPLTVRIGRVRCEGKVIYVGGRTATAEAKIFDAQDKLYAHATTCMIFRPTNEVKKS